MHLRYVAILLVLLTATSASAQLTHDIGILQVLPSRYTRMPINIPSPVKVEIANQGIAEADNVEIRVRVRDKNQLIRFDEQTTVSDLAAGIVYEATLGDFTPHSIGPYYVQAEIQYGPDEELEDNIREETALVAYETDVKAVEVLEPTDLSTRPQKMTFKLAGSFTNVGVMEHYEIPARVLIRRCPDNAVVFRADSVIPMLLRDSGNYSFTFPSRHEHWDVRKLSPGCYMVSMILRNSTDGNRINDTTTSEFTIIPNKLSNDVAVDSILSPRSNAQLPGKIAVPLQVRFKNVGKSTQTQVKALAIIANTAGKIVYRDSTVLTNWASDAIKTHTYKAFTPTVNDSYSLSIITMLPTDEYHYDDTLAQRFTVGYDRDAALSIVAPVDNGTHLVGTPLPIILKAEWLGNNHDFTGKVQVSVRDLSTNEIVVSSTAFFPTISQTNPVASLTIDDTLFDARIKTLAPGNYALHTDLHTNDNNDANNHAAVNFRITANRDIRPHAFLTPYDDEEVFVTPIPIKVRFWNDGSSDVSMARVRVMIETASSHQVIVYEETAFVSIASKDSIDVDFPPFTPGSSGRYSIYARSEMGDDEYTHNDWMSGSFDASFAKDLSVVFAIIPRDNARLPAGKSFVPTASVRLSGTETVAPTVDVGIEIRECISNNLQFSSMVLDTAIEGTMVVALPNHSGVSGTDDLEAGCYKAIFYVNSDDEMNRTNDTLIAQFELLDQASVSEVLKQGLLPWPNPTEGSVTVDTRGAKSITIGDLTGQEIRTIRTDGSNTLTIQLHDLDAGVYLIWLRSEDGSQIRSYKVVKQ